MNRTNIANSHVNPLFAGILNAFGNNEREAFIRAARAGQDNGAWTQHVPDYHLTLQSINAVVRRSNLDAEAKLSFIRAAIDVAINDAADNLIGDEEADAADYLKNKEIEQ